MPGPRPASAREILDTHRRPLRQVSSLDEAPIPAAANYLTQITFTYLTANGNAHAKNLSIIQDLHGRWQPSHAYDVPTSQIYNDQAMALPVGGRRDGNITGTRLVALGEANGLREPAAARRSVDAVARSADRWLDEIDGLPFDPSKLRKLRRVIANRQKMLRQ